MNLPKCFYSLSQIILAKKKLLNICTFLAFSLGYTSIVSTDISEICIEKQRLKYAQISEIKYLLVNALNLVVLWLIKVAVEL